MQPTLKIALRNPEGSGGIEAERLLGALNPKTCQVTLRQFREFISGTQPAQAACTFPDRDRPVDEVSGDAQPSLIFPESGLGPSGNRREL